MLILGAGAAGWALRVALEPTEVLDGAPSYALVDVIDGTVGRSLQLSATASWPSAVALTTRVDGVVTSLDATSAGADGAVAPGATVMTVDLRPVVVGVGTVPAFRDLGAGASGADVAQLQGLLSTLGYFPGAPDGTFGATTATAVRAWNRARGLPNDPVVRAGDVLWVDQLPARLRPAQGVVVGSSLAAGDSVFDVLAAVPQVRISLQDEQLDLVAVQAAVTITPSAGAPWSGVVAATGRDENGLAYADVTGPDGGAICGGDCSLIPAAGSTALAAEVEVLAPVTGAVVPAAAIGTDGDGSPFVLLADGTRTAVEVLVVAGGRAVVTGVVAGDVIRAEPLGEARAPGGDATDSPSSDSAP